ncbi:MAG TPA: beta-N-acetylhexosaminidase [Puia sp.]|nr:beta-N-acetylhexosaminidase [Puia sp.]
MKCLLVGLLLCSFTSIAQINIIPQPVSVKYTGLNGKFALGPETRIVVEGSGLQNSIDFFNSYLRTYYGFELQTASTSKGNNNLILNFERMDDSIPGAYRLTVDKKGIYIAGDNETGVFYAIQSLIQLLPMPSGGKELFIPYVEINDRPRFAYRGLMLDVGRHIMPLPFVKKFIDYLAMHKMNEFHWHLTEDQGWRIEIKKYPRLTEVGAWRDGTVIGKRPWKGNDNIRYGGFYTQDEIREVVTYASKRYITVIPEIEMPGHGSAAIAAYPWLSCFPNEKTNIPDSLLSEEGKKSNGKLVYEKWGVAEDVFCAGNDSVFMFLQDVIDEIIPLFPSQYIHVGGDECPKTNWKRCPRCQKRIQDLGLKDEHELQSYFIQRMEKYINSKGKTLIGWDEILEGGLAPNAIVMSWRGEKGGIEAAKQKHTVIMTPTTYVYLDYSQSKHDDSLVIGGYLPLEKVYQYEPVPPELSVNDGRYILGAQANIWTEYMTSPSKIEYMMFPRVDALSEVLWSPKSAKNWMSFKARLSFQFRRYNLWATHYFSDSSQYNIH